MWVIQKVCSLDKLLLHLFNGLFSRTTWISRHQKGKPFWILLEQEMMGWQWHQLDHIQIICTSLQTDNHASTSPLSFLQAGCPSCRPTNSVKAIKALALYIKGSLLCKSNKHTSCWNIYCIPTRYVYWICVGVQHNSL